MTSLEGGYTGADGSVERWLSSLFQPDPRQPNSVVEQPGNLVFLGGESTEQDAFARRSAYSFDKIRQAFFLHKMCQVGNKETIVKALADNFLISAFAAWNLGASKRAEFMRLQASTFLTNRDSSESIGTLPFCASEDEQTNEIFEVGALRVNRMQLESKIVELQQLIGSQQQLLNVAAEDKRVLTEALERSKETLNSAVFAVRDTDEKRYKQLQAATDVLVAEKNQELLQALDDARRNLDMFQRDRDSQVRQLEEIIRGLSTDLETKVQSERALAAKEIENGKLKCEATLAARDQEFNVAVTGKLNALATTHKNELAKAAAELNARESELRSTVKALDDLRKEFAMLATQAGAMRTKMSNMEEGIELREREIATLRNQLEDTRITNASRVQTLESQVVNLNLQLGSKAKQFDTEVAALRSQAQAACAEDVARLARQADERHAQAIASIRAASEARIAEISRANATQQMALRQQFEALAANDGHGGGGCTIV
jgi:hypothetical protein